VQTPTQAAFPGASAYPGAMKSSSQTILAGIGSLPWYCYAVVLAVVCAPIGFLWDISWHLSIGRDTFWTPAHMMIYMGGAGPGMLCGWLVLRDTFQGRPGEQAATVKLWGFRGPIGAWLIIWGSFVMLLSGPFDNWWHNAYGLDVQILSPPHTLLAVGTYGVAIGALLLVSSWHNRSEGMQALAAQLLVLVCCGILLTKMTIFLTEYIYPNFQHASRFYRACCQNLPLYLVVATRICKSRWAATWSSLIYMLIAVGMVWILPLFPAQAKLGPIYNPIDHMAPPPFPLLLVVPGIGVDLLMQRFGGRRGFWHDTWLALILGTVFFLALIGAQWWFSEFMLTPHARNWFFAGDAQWGYFDRLGDWCTRYWDIDKDPMTWKKGLVAAGFACLVSRIGLWFGNFLASVKR
jgi:hypothetical protein